MGYDAFAEPFPRSGLERVRTCAWHAVTPRVDMRGSRGYVPGCSPLPHSVPRGNVGQLGSGARCSLSCLEPRRVPMG